MHAENKELLDALNTCIALCEHCATASLQEENVKMMVRCISLDRDCADICRLTAAFVARGSEHAPHMLNECADICKACGDECEKHPMAYSQESAAACRRCEEACRAALSVAA